MKKLLLTLSLFSFPLFFLNAQENDETTIRDLYNTALEGQQGYHWLKQLTDIGPRLAGSPQANEAVVLFQQIADSLGFETHLQKVKVPHWVRGEKEVAYYVSKGKKFETHVTALGGSVSTPENGLSAPIVEITSFDELDEMPEDALKGKIAFYNIPMDPTFISTFFAYGNAVKQRWAGAVEASKKGARGVVIRSLSSSINIYPHTGSMTYEGAAYKIPSLAISTLDAEKLSKAYAKDPKLKFYMKASCRMADSTYSHNLIVDWKGSEKPDEYILTGGHIDSWDLGTGAHDDGAGSIHAFETAYLLMENNIRLKRTLRMVFFMNEEFGLDGANVYAQKSKEENINHVIAIESDAGGFTPRGISMVAPDSIINRIKDFRNLLEPYGIHQFSQTGAGADISRLYAEDLVMIGLRPDSHRYFEVHHSARDILENVNVRELEMGSATLAALVYLLDKYDLTAK